MQLNSPSQTKKSNYKSIIRKLDIAKTDGKRYNAGVVGMGLQPVLDKPISTYNDSEKEKKSWITHLFGGGLGCDVIFTVKTATRPSIAFAPFNGTVVLWLIPMLVFWSKPETYNTVVAYV
jgi:hypothetical protein